MHQIEPEDAIVTTGAPMRVDGAKSFFQRVKVAYIYMYMVLLRLFAHPRALPQCLGVVATLHEQLPEFTRANLINVNPRYITRDYHSHCWLMLRRFA